MQQVQKRRSRHALHGARTNGRPSQPVDPVVVWQAIQRRTEGQSWRIIAAALGLGLTRLETAVVNLVDHEPTPDEAVLLLKRQRSANGLINSATVIEAVVVAGLDAADIEGCIVSVAAASQDLQDGCDGPCSAGYAVPMLPARPRLSRQQQAQFDRLRREGWSVKSLAHHFGLPGEYVCDLLRLDHAFARA